MIRVMLSALLAFAALTLCRPVFSEEDRHFIDESKLPVDGSLMTDFVPAGWMIESVIVKDLDGDIKPDAVLTLIESLPQMTGEKISPARNRALVILLQTKTRRVSSNSPSQAVASMLHLLWYHGRSRGRRSRH